MRLPAPIPGTDAAPVYSDADAAALYDVLNPWGPSDDFHLRSVMAAPSVLDVGCGTGMLLHRARREGHSGRLCGVDPDEAALTRARIRPDVEWICGTAASLTFDGEFAHALMASNAFQCLVTDDELRASLAAIRRALRPGGAFVFGTRHLQARAWAAWNPANAGNLVLADGREIRGWHEVENVDGPLVTFTDTVARLDGTPLRVDRATLRFHTPETLNPFLLAAGFAVEHQFGDWDRGPLTAQSREIVTIARAG